MRTEDLNAFSKSFILQINNDIPFQDKVEKLLKELGEFFNFSKGFIYQTDGFRYFHLKESYGNENNVLRESFEIADMSEEHSKTTNHTFYRSKKEKATELELDILDFYHVNSLVIRHFKDIEGKIIGFIGFADIANDRVLNEEEMECLQMMTGLFSKDIVNREYKERGIRATKTLESIMNNQGVDIYVNSFHSHDMLYVNESMAKPYGGADKFTGKKCWQVLYNDKTEECSFCPKRNIVDENGNPTKKIYSWDYQRPFDKSWFRVFSAAFEWTDGQMAHVITSLDITHQKNIEEQLREAKEKAENLDRLKSAFLANMSHEIRTPLNAIVGFSDLLAITDDMEERMEYNEIVQENNQLLLKLISDILDLSKIEAGTLDFEIERINAYELCDSIVKSYSVNTNAKVPILFDETSSSEYFINSDKKRLTQVITNFINNAIKFTTEGSITVGYHLNGNNTIHFSVKDTGMGIAADKVDQVFDRFVQLDGFTKGAGLGLAICKSLIENLGGEIGINSVIKEGSTFWFNHPYQG
ncbi:sensor histidine kinase [Bacteroides sp. 214]|uniref:ATP-binding protein n=1 Tax=Bacteroides sp. 214 TaxID=2302935 RepID=UPI0013D0B8CF|nr:ATP-binding protein [Bacteroides sp. 214]NDW13221.1 sensor histidine kinase [Bacteroides sp. 214]